MKSISVVLLIFLVAASLAGPGTAQAATTPFSGFTGSGPFLLPYTNAAVGDFSLQPCGHDFDASGPLWYYDVQPFYVTASGPYTLTVTSSTFPFEDSVSVLYSDSFDPAAPHSNCLGMNDEYLIGPPFYSRILDYPFVAGVQYFLVVAPVVSGSQGNYGGDITGAAGTAVLGYVPVVPTATSPSPTSTTSAPLPTAAPVVERPPDDRLNWRRGDNHAALYLRRGGAGEPVLHLYCINESSRGYLGAVWGADDLALPAAPPTANLLVAGVDICKTPVRLYLLTTGEWALHIGPNAIGDVHALLWRDFPPTDRYEVRYNTTR